MCILHVKVIGSDGVLENRRLCPFSVCCRSNLEGNG